jgi:hypothetical protein
MRTLTAAATSAIALLGALLAFAPQPRADDCQTAFEQWSRMSSTHVRVDGQAVNGRGACIANEAARKELLDGLGHARASCGDGSSDPSTQQTRTLLNINQSFVSALVLCPGSQGTSADTGTGTGTGAGSGDGWAAKAAAAPQLTTPAPTAPKAVAATPVFGGPRPSVTAPATTTAPTPPCLEISQSPSEGFALVNRRCRGHTVLAVVETRDPGGETACKGYTISQSQAVRAAAPPKINYECVSAQGACNKDRLGDMFPECDW